MPRQRRVITEILLEDGVAIKTKRFKKYRYVGEPVSLVRTFCELNVQEISVVDKSFSSDGPNFTLLRSIASQCTLPISYSGSIKTLDDAIRIIDIGFEKVFINNAQYTHPDLLFSLINALGSQSVGISIDYRSSKLFRCDYVYTSSGTKRIMPLSRYLDHYLSLPASEFVFRSIDRDGMKIGFDLDLLPQILTKNLRLPWITLSGGGYESDHFHKMFEFSPLISASCSSFFTLYGAHSSVLPTNNLPTLQLR